MCTKCGWTGEPAPVKGDVDLLDDRPTESPTGECVIPTTPLRQLKRRKPPE
jgi:hypothetical protein